MSKKCIICNKGTSAGNNVSKSNRKTKRTFEANLQKIKILLNGTKVHKYVCTRCIKSNSITKVA